jgi:hypothetical protein
LALLRIVGTGDVYTVIGQANYPDGSIWHGAALVELRDGAVSTVTWVWGANFDAPEWRAKWVERIPAAPTEPK